MGRKGQERTLPEYYHRGVVAHLIGFDLPVVLDIEMLAPGEGEISAAKRLLERLMERYGRFFDAVVGDALFWEAPLFELCRKHDKRLLAVLKDNNPALLADAQALLQGEPDLSRKDSELHIQYWDREGFTSGAVDAPVRVLRTLETRNKRERIAGRWVQSQPTSEWFWASDIKASLLPPRQLSQAGRERWKIENRIFNAMSQHWQLDHCFHHQPQQAILNFLLILFITHILLSCFHRFNLKPAARRIHATLVSVARQLLQGIRALAPGDIPWCPPRAPARARP